MINKVLNYRKKGLNTKGSVHESSNITEVVFGMQLTERPPNLLLQSGQTESIDDVELDLEPGNHQLQELLLSGELDRTRHKSKHGARIGSSISVI